MRVTLDYRPALLGRSGIGRYVRELVRALARCADAPALDLHAVFWRGHDEAIAAASLPDSPSLSLRARRRPARLQAFLTNVGLGQDVGDLVHHTDYVRVPHRGNPAVFTLHDLAFLNGALWYLPEVRARIEAALSGALKGPWAQLTTLFEELLTRLPRRHTASETLEKLMDWFRALQERVEAAYLKAVRADEVVENTPEIIEQVSKKTQEMNPRGVISDPHILTTTKLDPVTSNSSEKEETAGVAPNAPPEERVDSELEDWVADVRKKRGAALDLPTVMQACPEFASWARNMGGYLKDWGDLHRVAGQLRPMIGVSEHAWNLAQDRLGPQIATAALVLTFDKHAKGEVASPGGYLRGMIEKAGAGELHLERSFYGRLSGQAA